MWYDVYVNVVWFVRAPCLFAQHSGRLGGRSWDQTESTDARTLVVLHVVRTASSGVCMPLECMISPLHLCENDVGIIPDARPRAC